jgi:hypothetical protein
VRTFERAAKIELGEPFELTLASGPRFGEPTVQLAVRLLLLDCESLGLAAPHRTVKRA